MSFLTRLRDFKDSILVRGISNTDFWLLKAIQRSSGSAAGVSVTADTALAVSAVYACVKVLAETIASLPLMLYERKGDGKEPASKHPLYPLLHDAPNDLQTSFEWREDLVAHIALRGNTYNQKVESGSGKLLELRPLNPVNMNPVVKDGNVIYEYAHEDGKKETFPANKIWHVKNMPISCSYSGGLPEGVVGLSPISVAHESVGLSLAADQYGGRYFSNNATVGLAISYPEGIALTDNAKTFLKESLAEYAKMENKFKSIILEKGGKLEKIGMSNEDSQFLESRQFQIEEIARIFRVPPIMIGHPTNTMTYASAEQLFLAFATYTIRPWCVRLEQSMNRYLIPERERGRYFFEFNLAGLLRGDTVSRFNAYSVARNWGWMNVDEIRSLENMNPLPDDKGKEYLKPLNMGLAGEKPEPPAAPVIPPAEPVKPGEPEIEEPVPKPKKTGRKVDPVDWEKVYAEGGAHWTEDLQPSKFAQDFAQKLIDEGKKSLLEIGCGNGRDSILFALAGLKVTSIDMVQDAVDMAKENAKNANVIADFQVGNAEKLTFEDKSFDAVFTLSVLHATNLKKSIPELVRVLKGKGIAFIYLYSSAEKISGEVTDFAKVNDFIDVLKNNELKIDDIYTQTEEEFDEAGEKHKIIVAWVRK